MKNKWSDELINETRRIAGDGCILKSSDGEFGFFSSTAGVGVKILGVKSESFMPVPSNEVIATFNSLDEMIDAGWVVD